MASKVLLVINHTSLMAKRLCALLGDTGIGTVVIEPELAKIKKIETEHGGTNILVLSAGDYLCYPAEVRVYLNDLCTRTDMCLIGYEKEIAEVKKTIPSELIEREFVRPVDINVIAEDIQDLICSGFDRKMEKRILLVDDDVSFLQLMQIWLEAKYRVAAVCSGAEALEYFEGHTTDLVLLDYDMPGMTGPQVLEMLRQGPKTAHLPVIFLTGKNDRDSVMSAVHLKPDGYILKSMSKDDILASVKRFFRTQEE